MKLSYGFLCGLSIITLFPYCAVQAGTVPLQISNKDLPALVKNQSFNSQETDLKKAQSLFQTELALQAYRWNLGGELSQETDKTTSLTTLQNSDLIRKKSSLLFSKKWLTGTLTSLELTQNDYNSKTTALKYNQSYATLSLEQNIFPFVFTAQDALTVQSLNNELHKAELQAEQDFDANLIEVTNIFWKLQTLKKSIEENSELLKKFEKLVKVIQTKKANSYANAGELEQAEAEYQTRLQTFQEDQTNYRLTVQQFKTLLNIPDEQELSFKYDTTTSEAKLASSSEKNQRFQIQKLRAESAENLFKAARLKGLPRFNVFAKYTQQGLDTSASESLQKLTDDSQNKYQIGIKFDYTIDDQQAEKEKQLRFVSQNLEIQKLNRFQIDLKQQINLAYDKLKNARNNLETTQKVLKLRQQAVQQININYNQGRSDISFLIDAFNRKAIAEVNAVSAMGFYEVALIEYQSLTR